MMKWFSRLSPRVRWWVEQVLSYGFAFLVLFAVRSALLEPFKIPSGSMFPGLMIGDHLFVNKFAYGLRVPFSDWIYREPSYLWKRESPKRGEVIVFLYPLNEDLYFIKRVIGIPGDVIEIREDRLYVNSQLIPRELLSEVEQKKILEDLAEPDYPPEKYLVYREFLGTEPHFILQAVRPHESYFGPFHVPPGHVFVIGDNRNDSADSRSWGFVEEGVIKGRAFLVWASFLLDPLEGDYGFRPLRTGTVIR